MMLFHTGKLRFLAVATTMLASMSFISAASAAGIRLMRWYKSTNRRCSLI